MNSPAYNRAAMNRKLHALLGQIARAGADVDAIKGDLAHQVSGGRTVHSSELDDAEHRRLVALVESRSPNGAASTEPAMREAPRRDRTHGGARRAGEPDARALPTAEQKRMVEQLAARAGFDEDGLRAWAKAALGFERATDRGRAHRLIEALKSHLVRRLDLPARCARLIAADDRERMLSTSERQVATELSTTSGRGRNRLAAGGILWAIDLCARHLGPVPGPEAQITECN